MLISLLHISDLHRSPTEPVNNDSLLAALVADGDRYLGESPRVPPPCAIVVSGDIIQGAKIGADKWREEMASQYATAKDFLARLADRFLAGDRSQLVLIPGNHDVCWNTSRSAMEKLNEGDTPSNFADLLQQPGGDYRWSWKERTSYRINDLTLYERRLDAYWDFVNDFYKGYDFPLPIDRPRGFQLFELDEKRILVASFDSTFGNDCFGYAGDIAPGVIARCSLAIRDLPRTYAMKAAVWHHSIEGPPMRQDYMDVSHVKEMAAYGFQIGFHGHQHVGATQTRSIHLNEEHAMAIVSAGSLCAGSRELPRGVNRQYNVVVIEDDFRAGRVHAREMGDAGQFSRKVNGEFALGYAQIGWKAQTNAVGQAVHADEDNIRKTVLKAEADLRSGFPETVLIELTEDTIAKSAYARKIATEAALAVKDWHYLVQLLEGTEDDIELALLASAFIEVKDWVRSNETIEKLQFKANPVAGQLRDRLILARLRAN